MKIYLFFSWLALASACLADSSSRLLEACETRYLETARLHQSKAANQKSPIEESVESRAALSRLAFEYWFYFGRKSGLPALEKFEILLAKQLKNDPHSIEQEDPLAMGSFTVRTGSFAVAKSGVSEFQDYLLNVKRKDYLADVRRFSKFLENVSKRGIQSERLFAPPNVK